MIAYIIFSETIFLLDTWAGGIALILSLTGCMLTWGFLLCVLVAHQNKKKGGTH